MNLAGTEKMDSARNTDGRASDRRAAAYAAAPAAPPFSWAARFVTADGLQRLLLGRLAAVSACGGSLALFFALRRYDAAAWLVLLVSLLVLLATLATFLISGTRQEESQLWLMLAAVDAVGIAVLSAAVGAFMAVFLVLALVELSRGGAGDRLMLLAGGAGALFALGLTFLAPPLSAITGWPLVPAVEQRVSLLFVVAGVLGAGGISLVQLRRQHRHVVSAYEQQRASSAAELHVAREIQQQLMAPPEWKSGDWSVAALSMPAREVGGDFYEYIPAHGNTLGGIAIGDISGKGMPAALLMAVVRTVFRIEARRRIFPAETLVHLNQSLRTEMPASMVTLLYAYIDPVGGWMHFANAGHNYPIVILGGKVAELKLPGLPLGIADDAEYREQSVRLPAGCSVLFYTDGLVEAEDPDGEMFGFERLLGLLESLGGLPPDELARSIAAEVSSFIAPAQQSDDISLVILHHAAAEAPTAAQAGVPPSAGALIRAGGPAVAGSAGGTGRGES